MADALATSATPRGGTVRSPDTRVIRPRPLGPARRVAEAWQYRGLAPFFAFDFASKAWANTWLGWWWVPLRPALSIIVRVLVFGTILRAPSGGVPYFIFFALGVAFWELFGVTWYFGTRSIELSKRYLKRIYVPRLVLLTASVSPGLMWCGVHLLIAEIGIFYYLAVDEKLYLNLGVNLLLALVGMTLMVGLALALGLWSSVFGAMGVRDPRWIVRQILHVWFYLTPVIYPLSAVPERFQGVMSANPLTAPMEMIRLGLVGYGDVRMSGVIITLVTILVIGFFGLRFFDSSEARSLDEL